MNSFSELFEGDRAVYGEKVPRWNYWFLFFLRKTQTCRSKILKKIYHLCFRMVSDRHCMEISYGAVIGKGLLLKEPFTITINSNSVLGENVTLGRNVTIGKQNRGKYAGSPLIGDRVEIGNNAVVVGKIRIGNNVRIAPDTYVNRDVPEGTCVYGNPFMIR